MATDRNATPKHVTETPLGLPGHLDGSIWLFRSQKPEGRLHRHAELEFNLIVRGQGRYLVADRRYDLTPDTLIWLYPGEEHLLIDPSRDFEMWIAVFTPSMVKRACTTPETDALRSHLPRGLICKQLVDTATRRLVSLMADVAGTDDNVDHYNAALSYLLLAAWEAHRQGAQLDSAADVHPSVENAVRLIRRGERDLSIDELAESCGLSASRLSRLFKQQIGVSVTEFRQRQRLERFFELYGQGRRHSLTDAALEAGFGSYPQFHRVFSKQMGKSPAAYRRQLRDE